MSQHVLGQRYRLVEPIGHGGMGTVWRAEDQLLNRQVAIKEMRVSASLDEETREELVLRTMREARICAAVIHPSVVTIHDVVREDGRPWIVMELVDGRGLDRMVEEDGPLPPRQVAAIGQQLVSALAVAHQAGALHRDVKPANVLVTGNGRAVLTDFGIAVSDSEQKLTLTGRLPGSPGYIAPERLSTGEITPASDLWSLGATLYYAVEGQSAYERPTAAARLSAPIAEEADPPRRAGPALGPVLLGMLRRDPAQRLHGPDLERALASVARGHDGTDQTPTALDVSGLTGPNQPIPRQVPRPTPTPAPSPLLHPGHPTPYLHSATAPYPHQTRWRRVVLTVLAGVITLILAPLLVEFISNQFF